MSALDQLNGKLKLAFSTAADTERLGGMFVPDVRNATDPANFLAQRTGDTFEAAVAAGGAAFLSDETGAPQTITVAYHLSADGDAAQHTHTEVGSSSSRIPGYKSANLVVAALALHEWFTHPPIEDIAAKIKPENIPSLRVYKEALGWQPVEDEHRRARLFDASITSLEGEDDPAALQDRTWFAVDDSVIAHQAEALLGFMDQGGLVNAKTGDFIPVDFTALDQEGLTREELQKIAQGKSRPPAPKV